MVQNWGVTTEATTDESAGPSPTRRWVSVTAVWLATAAGALAVALFVPTEQLYVWLPLVLAIAVILTFVIQLSLQNKVGLVSRITMSLGGALVILAVATLITVPGLFGTAA